MKESLYFKTVSITYFSHLPPFLFHTLGSLLERKRWDAEEHPTEEVRELGKSKWSEDFDEDENDHTNGRRGTTSALSGLVHAYRKEGKSVHWGDQV